MKTHRKILVNSLVTLLSVIFALFVLEGIVRVFKLVQMPEVINVGERKNLFIGPEFNYYYETNSLGLRGHREFNKKSKSIRVLFLGDSMTFGVGVSNNQTFSVITENMLNDNTSYSWTVINAGKSSTGTFEQKKLLANLLEQIDDIKMVNLFYFVENDPYETLNEFMKSQKKETAAVKRSLFFNVKSFFARKSALYLAIQLRLSHLGGLKTFPTIFDQCDPEKLDSFKEMDNLTKKLMLEIKEILERKNIIFSVVIIPRQEQLSSDNFEKFKKNYNVVDRKYDRFLPQKRVIENVLKPLDIKYLDLLQLFDGKNGGDYYYKFDGHFNEAGHKLVAGKMVPYLLEKLSGASVHKIK